MGHINVKGVYKDLQQRLHKNPIGAPESKELYEILRILFNEDEAEIASKMPMRFSNLETISKRTGKSKEYLKDILLTMAEKGLVIDVERDGETYYLQAPTVVGIFEFSMMRKRSDISQKTLAQWYELYMNKSDIFMNEVFKGETQLLRTLPHETAIPDDLYSEVLNYERATEIIKESKTSAVSLCYCRHITEHMDMRCKYPMNVCSSFGNAGEYLIHNGLAKRIEMLEALDILEMTREMGLVHMGDNVQKKISFICHCCACCCHILNALNRIRDYIPTMTSNFIAIVNKELCVGCGRCARRCPMNAIFLQGTSKPGELKANLEEEFCLGCGVCVGACNKNAMQMKLRTERVIRPQNTFERIVTMALERGKLQNILFDDHNNFTYTALNRLLGVFINLPPIKKTLLSKQIKSRFVDMIINRVK